MVKQITPFPSFLPSLVLTLFFFFLLEVILISSWILMFTARVEKMMQIASRPTMVMDRRWKTSYEIAPNCPRCASPNTKFCYYNNYSLSQPRHFCKGCRRYWTRGGSLRNVPVGGGCRKNRRSKSSTRTPPPNTNHVSPAVIPSTTTTSSGTNIDLGVVFAKFFNQTQNHDQVDTPFSLTASSSSDLLQFPEEQVQAEQLQKQKQSIEMLGCDDLVIAQDVQFIGGYEFGLEYPDLNFYGLHPMLSDEFSQATALWSGNTAPATVLPNFSWQTSQIQGLESVITPSVDHHLTFHPNVLLNEENFSSFDLSGYGISSSRSL